MTWIRLEDTFDQHPKTRMAGAQAVYLHIAALCYASRCLTDGFVAESLLPGMAGFTKTQAEKHAARLISVGLWEKAPNGFWIHDYLEYNRSREAVTKERNAAKERMQARRSGNVRANNSEQPRTRSENVREQEAEADTETEKIKILPTTPDNGAIFRIYEEAFGRGIPNDTVARQLVQAEEEHGRECLIHCFEAAAEAEVPDWRYVKRILERHQREGCDEEADDGHDYGADYQAALTELEERTRARFSASSLSRGTG